MWQCRNAVADLIASEYASRDKSERDFNRFKLFMDADCDGLLTVEDYIAAMRVMGTPVTTVSRCQTSNIIIMIPINA